ncbi:16S rRNA (cytidine(1402)-2'-O)-methyltransferase [Candidatus Daviesbacteria bacterium]|nr:16S rRNA (cytidine(1402)-2'-O)-methyltransferase [Candidatus Daviesbacteria bacterium]
MLTIIPTPIGNLKDITLRALEALRSCDGIICEDTRRTSVLLNHYEIKQPMMVLNDFNEEKTAPMLLEKLKQGQNFALVSDAGTPLISDPGYKLVKNCLEENITVDSLPGPTSVITALTLSGLPPDKFLFLGYLPQKQGKRKSMLEKIMQSNKILQTTYIIFVAPFKLTRTLGDMLEVFGDVEITLARELSKIHQAVEKQKLSFWMNKLSSQRPKGEIILLFTL